MDTATEALITTDAVEETPAEARARTTAWELSLRRRKVDQLRVRRMSEKKIAEILGVSEATISRDLTWIRENWQRVYGPQPELDRSALIGESGAVFLEIEATMFTEASKKDISPKDKKECLQLAKDARKEYVSLLQDMGILDRALGTLSLGLPTAEQIRHAIAAAALDPEDPALTIDAVVQRAIE